MATEMQEETDAHSIYIYNYIYIWGYAPHVVEKTNPPTKKNPVGKKALPRPKLRHLSLVTVGYGG